MKKVIFNIISILLIIICLATLGIFSYNIYKLSMIPNKYLITFYLIVIIILLLLILNIFRNSRLVTKIISLIFKVP